MPTRLSRYCDGLMEAGWLLAVIVAPLFFDVYSSRVFEPDKIAFLRTIALAVAVAWLLKLVAQGGPRFDQVATGGRPWRAILRFPTVAPVLALIGSLLISTALSVTPRVSLFGSYQRLQGTYSTLAYLVIFGSVLANLRRRSQLERLFTAIILTSLPVSLYGLLQRFRLDPLPWGGDTVTRVSANMGNPIFLGAYLIVVIPVTFGRVIETCSAIVRREAGQPWNVVRATIYVFTASVQLIALWFTGSRGPWLGFLAGSFFFFVLLTSYWRLRRLTIGTVGLAAGLGVFLVALNIPNGPLESLRSTPALGRLGHVFETEKETGLVRVLIWQGTAELVQPHAPIEYPDGRADAFNFLRPLIGYGPESMLVAFNRFYPPELGDVEQRTATPDRSHNETWDSLVTTGLIGLVAYLALFASVFYYGLKWLGLIQTAARRNLFIALYAGGGAAGAAGLVLWRGLPFFGVGLPFGIILGLIAYLTVLALSRAKEGPSAPSESRAVAPGSSRPDAWRATALIGLIAGVMAHFVEIHFSIAIAVSRTLFWLLAGLMIVVGRGLVADWEPQVEARPKEEGRRRRASRAARPVSQPSGAAGLAGGTVLGGLLAVTMFDFVNNPYHLTSAGAILWQALTTLPQAGRATSYAMLLVIGLTWLLGGLLVACEAWPGGRPPGARPWAVSLAVALGLSLGLALLDGLWLAATHARLALQPLTSQDELLSAISILNSLVTSAFVFGLGIMLVLGALLSAADRVPQSGRPPRSAAAAWLAAPLALAAAGGAYFTNLRVVHADVIYKTAESFATSNNWPVATRLYLLATEYAPNEDYYNLFVGKGFLQVADSLTDPAEQANLFAEAEQHLLDAQTLNPLNTDHTANLGRLYRWWASVAPTPDERRARAEKANSYYERALSLSPNSALLWNEWAGLKLAFLDDRAGALELINHSIELDPRYDRTWALLGDYHVALARSTSEASTVQTEYAQAADAYQQAVNLAPDSLSPRLALGAVYSSTGQLDKAIEWYGGALQYAPPETNLVNVYSALADLYLRSGLPDQALNYAQLALANAPDEMKPAMQELIQEIQTH